MYVFLQAWNMHRGWNSWQSFRCNIECDRFVTFTCDLITFQRWWCDFVWQSIRKCKNILWLQFIQFLVIDSPGHTSKCSFLFHLLFFFFSWSCYVPVRNCIIFGRRAFYWLAYIYSIGLHYCFNYYLFFVFRRLWKVWFVLLLFWHLYCVDFLNAQ